LHSDNKLLAFVKDIVSPVIPGPLEHLGLNVEKTEKLHQQTIIKLVGNIKTIAANNFKRVLGISISRLIVPANGGLVVQQALISYAGSLVCVHHLHHFNPILRLHLAYSAGKELLFVLRLATTTQKRRTKRIKAQLSMRIPSPQPRYVFFSERS
jgi:hypothetical protein